MRGSFILLPGRQNIFYMLKKCNGAALHLCNPFLRLLSHLESCALLENSCFVLNQFACLTWVVWGFSVYFGKAGTQPHRSVSCLLAALFTVGQHHLITQQHILPAVRHIKSLHSNYSATSTIGCPLISARCQKKVQLKI